MRVAVVVTAVAIGTSLVTAAPAEADVEVTYSVDQRGKVRGDLDRFERTVHRTLHDERGWSLAGEIEFRRVESGGELRVVLTSPGEIAAAASGCDERWSCRVGRYVLINDRRWHETTQSWTESRRSYRHYVINHEVGHFLGLSHADCADAGGPAPVMQQQSISLGKCRANVWPRLTELRMAAEAQGVPAPSSSPSPSPSVTPSSSVSPGPEDSANAVRPPETSATHIPRGDADSTAAQRENLLLRLLRYLSGHF